MLATHPTHMTPSKEATMNTDQTDLILQKTASVAFSYYPEIMIDSPEFDLWSEVNYCLEELPDGVLSAEEHSMLRTLIARAIVDPTKHRETLTDLLFELSDESTAEPDAQ